MSDTQLSASGRDPEIKISRTESIFRFLIVLGMVLGIHAFVYFTL